MNASSSHAPPPPEALRADLLETITRLNRAMTQPPPAPSPKPPAVPSPSDALARRSSGARSALPSIARTDPSPSTPAPRPLEELGFHSHLARQLPAQLRAMHGDWPPRDPGRAAAQLGEYLAAQWRRPAPLPGQCGLTHVLIGPSGSGKSTCLGKWLSQLVLAHSQPVKAFRLDGLTVNTAESLTVVGEALGVTVERTWNDATPDAPNTWRLIDLPGVDWRDSQAVADLERVLNGLGRPQIHLVLNAAYEAGILFDQIHAFSGLPVTDLIFTHMDEEPRHAKLWNFLLGTKHSIGYLSAGQNIPGNFHRASAERLLPVGFA